MRPSIFFHIPKTAGTSFIETLSYLYGASEQYVCPAVTDSDLREEIQSGSARNYLLFKGHFSVQAAQHLPCFDSAFKITILRDPIDRCLSLYGFLRGHSQEDLEIVNDYQKLHILYAMSFDLLDILRLPNESKWKTEYTRMFTQFIDYSEPPEVAAETILGMIDIVGFIDDINTLVRKTKDALWNELSIELPIPRLRPSSASLAQERSSYMEEIREDSELLESFRYDYDVISLIKSRLSSTASLT